jgi:hypothetical protein
MSVFRTKVHLFTISWNFGLPDAITTTDVRVRRHRFDAATTPEDRNWCLTSILRSVTSTERSNFANRRRKFRKMTECRNLTVQNLDHSVSQCDTL